MLKTGLKEWSWVCRRLEEGRQTFLLRKGGIHEDGGPGQFRLEHGRYVLFPAWAHQNPAQVKPEFAGQAQPMTEPAQLSLSAWAEAVAIHRVPDRDSLDRLDDLHGWNAAYLDQRWNYRPEQPLYVLVLRVHALNPPKVIAHRWEYGGCRSWVPLHPEDEVSPVSSRPVLNDIAFGEMANRIARLLHAVNR